MSAVKTGGVQPRAPSCRRVRRESCVVSRESCVV